MLMIVTDLLGWWYGAGLAEVLRQITGRARRVLGAFSVGLLARTLFAPFRQIDAGNVRGSFDVQMHAWFDRTFSRVMGFFIRSVVIVSGCLAALLMIIVGVVWAVLWFVLPVLPVAGVFLLLSGWTLA